MNSFKLETSKNNENVSAIRSIFLVIGCLMIVAGVIFFISFEDTTMAMVSIITSIIPFSFASLFQRLDKIIENLE